MHSDIAVCLGDNDLIIYRASLLDGDEWQKEATLQKVSHITAVADIQCETITLLTQDTHARIHSAVIRPSRYLRLNMHNRYLLSCFHSLLMRSLHAEQYPVMGIVFLPYCATVAARGSDIGRGLVPQERPDCHVLLRPQCVSHGDMLIAASWRSV